MTVKTIYNMIDDLGLVVSDRGAHIPPTPAPEVGVLYAVVLEFNDTKVKELRGGLCLYARFVQVNIYNGPPNSRVPVETVIAHLYDHNRWKLVNAHGGVNFMYLSTTSSPPARYDSASDTTFGSARYVVHHKR